MTLEEPRRFDRAAPDGPPGRTGEGPGVSALLAAPDLARLARLWIEGQAAQAGTGCGAVFAEGPAGLVALAALSPGDAARLLPVARAAAGSGRGAVLRDPEGGGVALAQPLRLDQWPGLAGGPETQAGAAALHLDNPSPARLRAAMHGLGWAAAWLRERAARDALAAARAEAHRLRGAHAALAGAFEAREVRASALRFATALADSLGADRVSVGLRRFGRTDIVAVSHSAEFGRRLKLNRLVAAAMDEALAQRAALTWPEPPGEPNATRAQAALSRDRGGAAVLSVPFRAEGGLWLGAVSLERPGEVPFSAADVAFADAAAALVGPALWEKAENDRILPVKIAATLRNQAGILLGPGHLGRKLAAVALVAATALFATWTGPFRVTAEGVVEGLVERSVVAPFDGFLIDAPVRAGDPVAAGQEVARLDDRDLALERLRWMTERRQRELELGRALGERQRAEAEIVRARIEQADAQIALADEQIRRARILAPFDGVVVSGDQSQRIGAAVRQGEVLFEIAPAEGRRVALAVEEADIGAIAQGQTGAMVVAARPGESFPIVIERITPVAEAAEGRNRFRVEARPLGPAPDLRPGMEGVGKIDVDERLMIDIWTRPLRDWVRLALWRWLG